MTPPIFQTCATDPAVTTLLGTNPVKLFQFGMAPDNVAKPYAVWQQVGGSPENYLGNTPDIDSVTTQIDVYATSPASARAVAVALRDAIEPVAHVVAWRGESRDPETGSYRSSFDVDWFVPRT